MKWSGCRQVVFMFCKVIPGSVYSHTLRCCDNFSCLNDEGREEIMLIANRVIWIKFKFLVSIRKWYCTTRRFLIGLDESAIDSFGIWILSCKTNYIFQKKSYHFEQFLKNFDSSKIVSHLFILYYSFNNILQVQRLANL